MNGEVNPPEATATAAPVLTGGTPAAVAPPPLSPNEARERLALTLGALTRTVSEVKGENAALRRRVEKLEAAVEEARALIAQYKPLVDKFVNGPGRVLLKV